MSRRLSRGEPTLRLTEIGSPLSDHTHVDSAVVVSLLNRMIDDAHSGRTVLHHLYTAADKATEPSRRNAGLSSFAASRRAFVVIAPGGTSGARCIQALLRLSETANGVCVLTNGVTTRNIHSMPSATRRPIRRKASTDLPQEAFVSLARTHAVLHDGVDQVLGPHGLSLTQYNVLRILRGGGPGGLCRNEIGERLITRMPDVTRLLDRMEAAGLVSRVRSTDDRRVVNTTLTRKGRSLVDALDAPVDEMHQQQLGHLSREELRTLIDLLNRARSAP